MKRIFLLIAAVVTAIFISFAEVTVYVDGLKYTLNDDKTAILSGYQTIPSNGAVSIPESITYDDIDYTVTCIGNSAFQFSSLTSVSIPKTVKTIEEKAFYTTDLDSNKGGVTLNEGLEVIKDEAFSRNSKLKTIYVPKTVKQITNGFVCNPMIGTERRPQIIMDPNNPNFKTIDGAIYSPDGSTLIYGPTEVSKYEMPLTVTSAESGSLSGIYIDTLIIAPHLDLTTPIMHNSNVIKIVVFPSKLNDLTFAHEWCNRIHTTSVIPYVGNLSPKLSSFTAGKPKIGYWPPQMKSQYTSTWTDLGTHLTYTAPIGKPLYQYSESFGISSNSITVTFTEVATEVASIESISMDDMISVCIGENVFRVSGLESKKEYTLTFNLKLGGSSYTYPISQKITTPAFTGGVEDVITDEVNSPAEYYNLQGVKVGNTQDGLSAGIYIRKQGGVCTKIIVH